jgi:D-alanyl-D-alanine carboxypeptidase
MPLSLLRWSLTLFVLCLLAPSAFAAERVRSAASQQPKKKKKKATRKPAPQKRFVRISGGEHLRHDAASSFEQMYSEARDAGLWLWVISGHRTWAEQRSLYRLYRKGLGARAARPGRSNHQRGTAVDISVGSIHTRTYEWLAANACRFGYKRTVRSEPWHWEYRPRSTPAPLPDQDCLGRPLTPAAPAPPQSVATPSPS